MKKARKTVCVAMSGGVDSSVTAALLKKQGYVVFGVHIRCFNVDGCAERDANDARRVAEQLNIPFYTFDLEKEYKERVVEYMVKGYTQGITPNPDVMCNKEIKFGLFLKRALELGAGSIATGHYVRIRVADAIPSTRSGFSSRNLRWSSRRAGFDVAPLQAYQNHRAALPQSFGNGITTPHFSLLIAKDKNKDQSYFLWTLTQKQLQHCLFPLGEYTKPAVRALAKKYNLPTAEKKDSQGICFLGQVSLANFLKSYIPARRGAVLTTTGKTIGEHRGAPLYTIGQRHGFTIKIQDSLPRQNCGGQARFKIQEKKRDALPHYVIEKNITANTLTVAEGNANPALYKKEIMLNDIHFINPLYPKPPSLNPLPLLARVRYRAPLAPATLAQLSTNNYKLIFKYPQRCIAPGQSAVFYNSKKEMLGGGIIA